MPSDFIVPITISARHVHLSRAHLDFLFGVGYELRVRQYLIGSEYAAEETVTVVGPRRPIPDVRILGPVRRETQVEISRTDEFVLGVDGPIRASGRLEGTPGIRLVGPCGNLDLDHGLIQALRHIHMGPDDAIRAGVKDGDIVMVRISGERGIVFDDVLIRVGPWPVEMHLDTDEANAADLAPGDTGTLIVGPAVVKPTPED